MSNNTTHVFVYGTLKRGYQNHRLLRECEYVTEGYARGCPLVDLGGYPGMIVASCDNAEFAEGEIYKLPEDVRMARAILSSLDRLEQEGRLYKRVTMSIGTAGESIECITYLLMMPLRTTFVEGGCWTPSTLTQETK